MQQREAEHAVQTLLDAFPQVALRERTASIYIEWVRDLDREQVEEAVGVLIASSITLPTVAEVRRLVLESQFDVPTAEQAWISVNERGNQLHDLTKEVVRSFGGVYNIRTAEEPSIIRAQFLKAYEAARERHLRALNTESYRRSRIRSQAA